MIEVFKLFRENILERQDEIQKMRVITLASTPMLDLRFDNLTDILIATNKTIKELESRESKVME